MVMRFQLKDAGGRTEFWVFDAEPRLEPALSGLWWEPVGGGWRRAFACPPLQAEPAFGNLTRMLLPTLRQAADLDPVPWQDALAEVCRRFEGQVDWWLGGSAALAARGAPVRPHDLDLIVAEADSVLAGELLADGLIEPVTTSEWDLSTWWGRAFVHARIEWAGGVTALADQPDLTDFGPTAASALEPIRWRDWLVRVPPLHLQRAVSRRRGLLDRVAVIDQLRADGQGAADQAG
jgi:hypothetical protein